MLPAGEHDLFADHLTAEYAVRVTMRGRTFDKWTMRPDRSDNHWLDTLVGSAVAASVSGLSWSANAGAIPTPQAPRTKLKLSEIQARKRQEAATR